MLRFIKALLTAALLLIPGPVLANSSFALVGYASAQGNGSTITTTPTIDTTGSDLLLVTISGLVGSSSHISTNYHAGSSFTLLQSTCDGSTGCNQVYYCRCTGNGTGDFATINSGPYFATMIFTAWSGSFSGTIADQTAGTGSLTSTSQSSGSITPSGNGYLVITTMTGDTDGSLDYTVSAPFSPYLTALNGSTGVAYGGGFAYEIQCSATARNATWTQTTNGKIVVNIASLVPASYTACGGGGVTASKTLMGIGH